MTLQIDVQGRAGQRDISAVLTLDDASLVLAGPNGAGKTSLLLMVLGILTPQRGRIVLNGTALFDTDSATDLPTEKRGLAYVPQDFGLFSHMTVRDNVVFALACHRLEPNRSARRDRAMQLLADLQIADLAHRRPATLSAGERQRVALARALAIQPSALLLDEPLAALDIGARRQVREFLVATLARLSLPALIVTHDPADAAVLGEQVAIMEAGRITQLGSLASLRAEPASAFVAEFAASC